MDGAQHTKRTFSNFIAINVSSQTMRGKKEGGEGRRGKEKENDRRRNKK